MNRQEDHVRVVVDSLRQRAERSVAHVERRRCDRFTSEETLALITEEAERDYAAATYLEIALRKGSFS